MNTDKKSCAWSEIAPASWSAVAERSDDTAFPRRTAPAAIDTRAAESGVALRLPPQSKTSRRFERSLNPCPSVFIRGSD